MPLLHTAATDIYLLLVEFWVNGTAIPDVHFDVGESYAGLLPISEKRGETRKLWFWFFPTTGKIKDEVVVWLNGGPGYVLHPIKNLLSIADLA